MIPPCHASVICASGIGQLQTTPPVAGVKLSTVKCGNYGGPDDSVPLGEGRLVGPSFQLENEQVKLNCLWQLT